MLVAVLLIFSFSGCLLAFQLALGSHFRHGGALAPPMRALAVLSVAVWAAAVVRLCQAGPPGKGGLTAAVALLVFAAALFAGARLSTPPRVLPAAFDDSPPERIVRAGPYRWVRHPFYVSYMAYWIGLAFAAAHWTVWIGSAIIVAAYQFLAHREETRLLQGPLGNEYREYFDETGRFLPRP